MLTREIQIKKRSKPKVGKKSRYESIKRRPSRESLIGIGNTIQELYVKELEIHKVLRHYLYVRKKRSQNEFEEDIDRELE